MNPADLQKFITEVASAYGLGAVQSIQALGGTATPKWTIKTSDGRYVVRIRPDEFSDASQSTLTHQALIKLADAGLPVPRPLLQSSGETLYNHGNSVIEVLEWIDGDMWIGSSPEAFRNLGVFLAKFHTTLGSDFVNTSEIKLREDHPDALQSLMDTLLARASDEATHEQLSLINNLLQQGRDELENTLYLSLPRAAIHGDFHPGNVRFRAADIAALYDFDYLAVQARSRDIIDALMFFASDRLTLFEPDNIRSLTQPFTPNFTASQVVLAGYQSISPLTSDEWIALPLLLRSRWIQMRLRGSRKVPAAEKLGFVLTDFFAIPNWIQKEGLNFFDQLRNESPA